MNIINKLTLRHLKNNRSRTILTIIGICVSVAMVTAIFTGIYSYLDYQGRLVIYTSGDYHFSVTASDEKLSEVLDNDKRIKSYGIEYNIDSDASCYRLKNGKSKYNSVGTWFVGDKNRLNQMITCQYDGVFPENSNEILVEEKLITDNKLDWKIGDTVSIENGARYIGDHYFQFPQRGPYSPYEFFEYCSTDSYKITGILHDNFPTKGTGIMIFRGADENQEGTKHAYVKLKRVTPFSANVINDIIDKFGFTEKEKLYGTSMHSEYLQTRLAFDYRENTIVKYLPMFAVLLIMIIVASVVLIYNSFGMSLNERIKYLGMLSSIGATKKQKKNSVIYEALMLSAVGIPTGILTGFAVVSILFLLIGERIKSSALSGDLGSVSAVKLDLRVSLIAVLITVVIGIATVLLSAIIPSKRASAVSPIDAIRQKDKYKIKRKIRTPFFVKKIFGYEGELAYKNMRRNGAKSRIIVASIALSLVLFLGCNYFCNMFVVSSGLDKRVPYQVEVNFSEVDVNDNKILNDFKKFAENEPEIKKAYLITCDEWLTRDELYHADGDVDLLDDMLNVNTLNRDYKDLADYQGDVYYNVIEDEVFNQLCKDNGIDYKQFYDYEYGCSDYDEEHVRYRVKKPIRVLLLNNFNHTDNNEKPFNENVIGTTQGNRKNPESEEFLNDLFGEDCEITPEMKKQAIKEAEAESYLEEYVIQGLVDYDENNYIFHLNNPNTISAYYPFSVFKNKYETVGDDVETLWFNLGVETDTHVHTTDIIQQYIEKNELEEVASVYDSEIWRDSAKARILVLQVLIYGFIILISIITITNIINTINNSVNHRKKEFAMLKSVGLEPKGFKKMLSLESLFYALEGILFGLPLSVLACYVINKMMSAIAIPFAMDVKMCIICVCVVFVIIGLTMLYSSAKIRNNSIIEELKTDIN